MESFSVDESADKEDAGVECSDVPLVRPEVYTSPVECWQSDRMLEAKDISVDAESQLWRQNLCEVIGHSLGQL